MSSVLQANPNVPSAVRMGPRRLAHGNIFVGDLQRARSFYEQVCGVKHVFSEPGIMAEFHSNGNSHHDLGLMQVAKVERRGRDGHLQVSTERGHTPGLNHLGFEMDSEAALVEAWKRVEASGLKVRTTDHRMSHSVYVFDPEDNYLEFYADVIDDWREFYRQAQGELISGDWSPAARAPDPARRWTPKFDPARVDGAPLHPRRINRATLAVSDLPRMVEYYTDFAGLRLVAGGVAQGYAVFAGSAGEPTVALFARGSEKQGLHHFGFEMPDERSVDEAAAALRSKGIPVLLEVAHAAKKSVVIADPDGLKLEFYAVRAGALPAADALGEAERFYVI